METICLNRQGLSQKDISRQLAIPKSSLSALLTDLINREYIILDSSTRRYVMGPQLLVMAGRYLDNQDVVGHGRPLVSALTRETGESGALAIPVGWDALIVYKEDCVQPVLPSIQVGTRLPFYGSAVGKAMLAHFPPDEVRRYLDSMEFIPLTRHTITSKDELAAELEEIRNGAPAYNSQGYREGISALAAPVFDHSGRVTAAVAISALAIRLTPDKEERFKDILKRTTDRFSRLLGHSGI